MEKPLYTNRDPSAGVLIRLRGLFPSLKTALQKVANVILEQPEMAVYASVNEVAAAAGVSEATVMRFCRILGFKGFQDFKIALAREMVAPLERVQEEVEEDTAAAVVRKVFQNNIAALQDTLEVLDPEAMAVAVQAMLQARRIAIIGVAGSQPMVQYGANRFFRLGLDVHCYTDALLMMMAATLLTQDDVLLTISQSGATREILEAVKVARQSGAKVIAITNNSLSPLARSSDAVLITAARETRLTSETVASRLCQMAIIDALFALIYRAQPEQAKESLEKIEKVITKEY